MDQKKKRLMLQLMLCRLRSNLHPHLHPHRLLHPHLRTHRRSLRLPSSTRRLLDRQTFEVRLDCAVLSVACHHRHHWSSTLPHNLSSLDCWVRSGCPTPRHYRKPLLRRTRHCLALHTCLTTYKRVIIKQSIFLTMYYAYKTKYVI